MKIYPAHSVCRCETPSMRRMEAAAHGVCRMRRRGVAAVVVLILLGVSTMIFLSALKLIAIERQSVELQIREIQAGWLAESAVQRASARLAADDAYHGETWTLSAQDLGGRDGARIVIRVHEVAGKPDRRAVHVEADYPDEEDRRSQRIRDVIVDTKAK
jgi:Tfp pilus assembly protein PilX